MVSFFLLFPLQHITREQFEDALKEIQDEGLIVAMGKNTIRICWAPFHVALISC